MGAWLRTLFSGRPHFYIGGREQPYMMRWYLIPRNGWLNIYLHKFLRDDDDRACHDHPWWFLSFMVRGSYLEYRHPFGLALPYCTRRNSPSIAFRKSTDRHRVELLNDHQGGPIPCWTIVITGRKVREWGFWCPRGFVPWHQFVDHKDEGNIGKGCAE